MLLLAIAAVLALPLPNEYNVGEAALIAAGAGTAAGVVSGLAIATTKNHLLAANPQEKFRLSVPYAAARDGLRIGVAGGAGVAVGTLVANQLQTKSKVERNAVGGMAGGAVGMGLSVADAGPRVMLAGAVSGAVVGGLAGLVAGA